ncbi:MAG: tRNA preQ1(34) S-adenosylmethionine ribosyltransferase-isomerase QueA, partial [Ghiorsea sp.]
MQVTDFDFELPEHLIAKSPMLQRDGSRLLCLEDNQDRMIQDLPQLVNKGDVWVINDTKVIPARLMGNKESGGKVEILLLEPLGDNHVWSAWGKSNKALQVGSHIRFSDTFSGKIMARQGKEVEILLLAQDVGKAIEGHGHMPLPPYINRPDTEEDKQRYQTVFAKHQGAVAAPTAGLHFTDDLMLKMEEAGAVFVHITLHVGPGTFQPVQVENTTEHIMHEEAYIISEHAAATINQAKSEGRRIVAVGTTSLRSLEAAGQSGVLQAGAARTDIFITPGYQFKIIDALL